MKKIFITGTDTGCGKTYITCQLLDYLIKNQKKAFALKPVATGGIQDQSGQILNEDVLNLTSYNNRAPISIDHPINGWTFPLPISPHLAAKDVGHKIEIKDLINFCQNVQFSDLDYLLIEGAGGLLVPLNDEETWLDFLKRMNIHVILVVGMRLGCLNHALLTDSALQAHQIPCVGWIANCLDSDMVQRTENINTLTKKMNMPLLEIIHYGSSFSHVIPFD